MLDALSWNDSLHIPRDLIVLIRERLSGSHPEYQKSIAAYEKRQNALSIGAQLKAQGITPSFRRIAELLEVAPSTVKRLFPDRGEFEKRVERESKWLTKRRTPPAGRVSYQAYSQASRAFAKNSARPLREK